MTKKKILGLIVLILLIVYVFHTCNYDYEFSYNSVKVGESFLHTKDGHFEKLPHNYCMSIDLSSTCNVFKVPEDELDIPFLFGDEQHDAVYTNPKILEGHFIEGYFDSNYLVLCEEYLNRDIVYLTFEFATEEIQYYDTLDPIYELLDVDSIDWFSLCNTVDQWIDIPEELLTAD